MADYVQEKYNISVMHALAAGDQRIPVLGVALFSMLGVSPGVFRAACRSDGGAPDLRGLRVTRGGISLLTGRISTCTT